MSPLQGDESIGFVYSCVYICDGELKRNVSFLLHVRNGTAYCELQTETKITMYKVKQVPSNTYLCYNNMTLKKSCHVFYRPC